MGGTNKGASAPRILGGLYRGRSLSVPKGRATRPLRVMARQSLFDILGPAVAGTRFLDLYAGSGSVGIEAASRGAIHVTLVENSSLAHAALEETVQRIGIENSVSLISTSAESYVHRTDEEKFDYIYLGPPYPHFRDPEDTGLADVLRSVHDLATAGGMIILETPTGLHLPSVRGRTSVRSESYGDTTIHLLAEETGEAV